MVDQRVACTWGSGEVEGWRSTVRKGTKLMYWIVSLVCQEEALVLLLCCLAPCEILTAVQALGDETPNKEKMMGDHFKLFPKVRNHVYHSSTATVLVCLLYQKTTSLALYILGCLY
jgi:hypothetical protein